jgi:transcriptional regulator with XRE-family HTH domain
MKDWNRIPVSNTQLIKMNKPKRHKSKLIQQIQEQRSVAGFEKIKKRMLLAAKIQDAIKAKKLSYSAFAELMDQHVSVISKWVSGTHNFTADTLFDIEEKLDVLLISLSDDETKEIVHKFNLEVSIKTDDILSSGFAPSLLLTEKGIHQYISHCGGMAVTSVSTQFLNK